MSRNRSNIKGRREKGAFVQVPLDVLRHANFKKLSHTGRTLFTALLGELRYGKHGLNNGDLCATHSMMKEFFPSKSTLRCALDELLYYGFIIQTRKGIQLRSDRPNLYAFTFLAIDECGGKLDVASTVAPPGGWREEKPKYKKPETEKRRKKDPENLFSTANVPHRYGKCTEETNNETKNTAVGTASVPKTAISGSPSVRQTYNFLESAIGVSKNSLSESDNMADKVRAVELSENERADRKRMLFPNRSSDMDVTENGIRAMMAQKRKEQEVTKDEQADS